MGRVRGVFGSGDDHLGHIIEALGMDPEAVGDNSQ